jgi:hypothetical protein
MEWMLSKMTRLKLAGTTGLAGQRHITHEVLAAQRKKFDLQ